MASFSPNRIYISNLLNIGNTRPGDNFANIEMRKALLLQLGEFRGFEGGGRREEYDLVTSRQAGSGGGLVAGGL